MNINMKILSVAAIAFILAGCSFSDSFMRAQHMPAATSTISNAPMIFGGPNRDIYLGNISADQTNADSIYNKKGKYGDPSSELSINNKEGKYGSAASVLSACNPYATIPPILVDKYNAVLGDFTLNQDFKRLLPPKIVDALLKICK